jgi:hypothetical protein
VFDGGEPVAIDGAPDVLGSFLNAANGYLRGIEPSNAKVVAYRLLPYSAARNYDGP